MDERFQFLVIKSFEENLAGAELMEFEKYLEEPECRTYLQEAKDVNQLINYGLNKLVAKMDPGEILSGKHYHPVETDPDEQFLRARQDPAIREKVKNAHRLMLLKRKRILWYSFASSIAAAVLFALLILSPWSPENIPELTYNTYYKPYFFHNTVRGPAPSEGLFDEAISLYIYQSYSEGAKLCKEILNTPGFNPKTHFLYGLFLMEEDSMQQAIVHFNIFISNSVKRTSMDYVAAHWYAGLCYVASGQPDSALSILSKIENLVEIERNGRDVTGLMQEIRNWPPAELPSTTP